MGKEDEEGVEKMSSSLSENETRWKSLKRSARESHAEREDSWERVVQGVGGGLGKSTSS